MAVLINFIYHSLTLASWELILSPPSRVGFAKPRAEREGANPFPLGFLTLHHSLQDLHSAEEEYPDDLDATHHDGNDSEDDGHDRHPFPLGA